MHNSKLLTLIGSLQQEEIHWFQKFLKSPFYNTNELYVNLFDHIRKYYPDLSSPKLSKEYSYQKLFPNEKVNLQKIRKTMHGLATLTEEFLVAMQIRKKPFEKKKLLAKDLGERNVYSLFKKGTNELLGELEALPYRDVNYYKEVHELNLNFYGHLQTNKQKGNNEVLVSAANHLNYYYLTQRQRLDFAFKWHQILFGDKFKIGSLEQAEKTIKNTIAFKLYSLRIKALKKDDDEIYLNMENLFKDKVDQLGKSDQTEVYRVLLNHLSSHINKGNTSYRSKLLLLYKFGLQHKIIAQGKQFNAVTFINIAAIGIAEKEFEWTENFISKYKNWLPEVNKQSAVSYVLSSFNLHTHNYEKAIELVSNQTFSISSLTFNAKTILIRSYFELFLSDDSYYDLLIAQLNAFEKMIRRKDLISVSKKDVYLNFILFTRKLTNIIFQKKTAQNLYLSIKESKSIALKEWLLEKTKSVL